MLAEMGPGHLPLQDTCAVMPMWADGILAEQHWPHLVPHGPCWGSLQSPVCPFLSPVLFDVPPKSQQVRLRLREYHWHHDIPLPHMGFTAHPQLFKDSRSWLHQELQIELCVEAANL